MVFGNKVIFGNSDGILRAIDKVSGKLISGHTLLIIRLPVIQNVWTSSNRSGSLTGSYDYYLHCIDPHTGKSLWKVETENYINGTPAILNGKIVFGGCDGMIRVVDPLTGKENDTINIGVYIASSPALSGNLAYFRGLSTVQYIVSTSRPKRSSGRFREPEKEAQ